MDAELDRDPHQADRCAQLRLIDPPPPAWRLDEHTREVGRLGIAAARAALRTARPQTDPEQDRADHGRPEHDHHERSAA